ncbi:MAG TPA: hypothetical protein DF296_08485 [Candidatus Margulisbacteria bacterium]|nr:MAG: hypothetical protein A2X43_08155 [Candidatus Margulisbacteria bacterium GWD2_39_127]OGI01652.1 MAG: hypothetical protein A2X42_04830 [Candidatus Margulisbacteria bacterium GWF2_38_17]OGI06910.1 MAG: hypothetical protein A2X41_10535 [Candidatus Margulisbacteria bacterium GWE2_39_32]HAR63616.1 hypothetical protein [Candidatus Margulisiibacteriota bacterium]HCT85223.1 hypothetical protein [Candidatus Margulisiibacteriota bacterium]
MRIIRMFFCLVLVLCTVFVLSACSKLSDGMDTDKSKVMKDLTPLQSSKVLEFDKKLGEVKDEQTAQAAVGFFANQVASNMISTSTTSKGISTQSIKTLSSPSLIQKFAHIEAVARSKKSGISIQSLVENNDMVTVEKLTDIMNTMQPIDVAGKLTVEDVRNTQQVIRDNIPNLASNQTTAMTPLEASVITYYVLTGDDGSGKSSTEKLYASNEDVQKFTEKILTDNTVTIVGGNQ